MIVSIEASVGGPQSFRPENTRMFQALSSLACLAFESNHVIGLRLHKMSLGGVAAWDESHLMVVEKVRASEDALRHLASGRTFDSVVTDYRTVVQANVRRLSA